MALHYPAPSSVTPPLPYPRGLAPAGLHLTSIQLLSLLRARPSLTHPSPAPPLTGLHPLAPYFAKFVADEVASGLRSLPTLHMVLRLVSALLQNPDMRLEHYVHQLLPPVLTCLVAKSLGGLVRGSPMWIGRSQLEVGW